MAQCPLENTRVIFQEREETSQRALAIRHIGQNFVLNTGQMRDAAAIQPHYIPIQPTRMREDIIHQAAMREVALARRRNVTSRTQQTGSQVTSSSSAAPRGPPSETQMGSSASGSSWQFPQPSPASGSWQTLGPSTSGQNVTSPAAPGIAHYTYPHMLRPIATDHARRTALLSSYNVASTM